MSIKSLSIQSFPIKTVIGFSIAIALLIVNGFASPAGTDAVAAAAIGGHGNHGGDNRPDIWPEPAEVQAQISELREATARFHDIEVALKEGYAPFGDCFANPPEGNMGYHYANAELMEDPGVDPNHPELLLYEKQTDGTFKFVGVEYLTFQAAWHKAGEPLPAEVVRREIPPQLDAARRALLPAARLAVEVQPERAFR
jgi:hypothetical protein